MVLLHECKKLCIFLLCYIDITNFVIFDFCYILHFQGDFHRQKCNFEVDKIVISQLQCRNFKLFYFARIFSPCASAFVHNMCNQAEVAFDEDISGFQVSLGAEGKIVLLLLGGQGLGKASGGQLQRVKHTAEYKPKIGDHTPHLHHTLFPTARPFSRKPHIDF